MILNQPSGSQRLDVLQRYGPPPPPPAPPFGVFTLKIKTLIVAKRWNAAKYIYSSTVLKA